jgi:hypothetical protein
LIEGSMPAPLRCGQARRRPVNILMMQAAQTAIHYNVAQHQVGQNQRVQRHQKAVALNQFRNSYCDQMDSADLYHYAWATGHSVEWLLERAKWNDPRGVNGTFFERAVEDKDVELLERVFFLP